MPEYSVILLAAGKGTRTRLDYNKVFYELKPGLSVLDLSLQKFAEDPDCTDIQVVCAPAELEEVKRRYAGRSKTDFVCGGKERQDSVGCGLKQVKSPVVFIHDAARPFVKKEDLEKLKSAMETEKAALLVMPAVDTIKIVDENGYVKSTPARNTVCHAQTPQAFDTELIRACHLKAGTSGFLGTDDASLVETFTDVPVLCIPGDPSNIKITHPSDLEKISNR